jgi:hypothetical protein
MGGLLGFALTAVAIVATVMSGGTLGIIAGAMMAASYAASQGWIGGSVGKFFNSSTGHYLTMAVGLASAATSIMANTAAVTATSASATTAGANAAAEGATQAGVDAIGTQANTALAADQADSLAAASGAGKIGAETLASNTAAPLVSGSSAQTMSQGGLSQFSGALNQNSSIPGTLSPAQTAAASASNAQVDKTLGFATNSAPDVSGSVSAPSAATQEAGAGQQAGQNLAASQKVVDPNLSTNFSVSADPNAVATPTQTAQSGANFNGAASPGPSTGSQAMGMLSKAGDMIDKHAGLATVAGNALSGMAQGASQQKMMQEQIAAQQWGNMQWQDPTQVAKLQAAAAQPIGVPVGYLNRAAAVRNLMNNSTSQTAPLSGQAPVAPNGQAPVAPTVKPVGM